ncbi:DNA replication factor C, large subunit [Schizopora paradoxa]|uniref:Replication factor C subunit 1 n=1 Tax=Schizopora paradoxa TaxID=27342 RepID=A0A0H2RQE5_9AGAM|nr:DNA replication factor C, large subunit [Schizopora paradoxa]
MSQSTKTAKPSGAKDIRSFFGGGGGGSNASSSANGASRVAKQSISAKPSKPNLKTSKSSDVIEIDMDEDAKAPSTSKQATPPKRKRQSMVVSSDDEDVELVRTSPPKKQKSTPQSVSASQKKSATIASKTKASETPKTTSAKTNGSSSKSRKVIGSSEDDDEPPKKTVTAISKPKASDTPKTSSEKTNGSKSKARNYVESSDEDVPPKKSTTATKAKETLKISSSKANGSASKSRMIIESDDDDDAPIKKSVPAKSKSKARKSVEEVPDDDVRDKKGKGKATESKKSTEVPKTSQGSGSAKFNWAAAKAAKMAGPSAPGSKPIPNGEPNCLAGLSFVFTGELTSFAREEAVELAKRFGGRVVGQPSSVTNYVVLGDNAGPAKLKAIQKHGLKTLNEDEFLDMIATRKGVLDQKTKAKMAKEEKAIEEAAKEMERAERAADKAAAKASSKGAKPIVDSSSQLWTSRYAPKQLKDICGNKQAAEKLQGWLHDWSSSLESGFKKPGKNGMNIFRAVLITGPPGIGKTTSAHLIAKLEGFTPIELNASDARSKKLVENSTNIYNTSLDGWMGGTEAKNAVGVPITNKSCLIMDEVDGMSAGDRGGVGALNALIKKTKIPIICIANDRNAMKLKPLTHTTFNLPFKKPEIKQIRSRILSILFKEKMDVKPNVVDELIQGAQSDIRQIINMLSTWKLSNASMDFDEGKNLAKANEKYTIMTPFNVTQKILGPYLFSHTARETLNEKMELYFHDHAFIPLFIQENYLKTEPAKVRNLDGPEKILTQLRLLDRAATSLSDSDLVDALIHGPEQHWSLMPLHAVTSTVRPASFVYGNGAGYGGPNAMSFPQWLGQNSKQTKLQRQLNDVQIKMRLKVSGDKPEIRQNYIPALFPRVVKPLVDTGASAIDEVIEAMDDYYLSKDEWDTIVELGLDENKDSAVLKKISTTTKTTFTKKYNAGEHPVPFHKAQEFGKAPKKLSGGPAPDLEDIFDLEDDVEEEVDVKDDEGSDDLSKDSLIKEAKGKGKGKKAVTAPAKESKAKSKK